MNRLLRWFDYQHLPQYLQDISSPISDLAHQMDAALPECAEKEAGLRKLIEAKDSFVRARVEAEDNV